MSQGKRVGIFLAVFLVFCVAVLKSVGVREPWGNELGIMEGTKGQLSVFWELEGAGAGSEVSGEGKIRTLEGLGYILTEEEKETARSEKGAGYADLLAEFGWGQYNYDTGEWSPTSDWVYALDTEIFDIENMYPNFFAGLLSISGDEVPITDVVQDDSRVNWEKGTGTWIITLNYAGKPYTIKTQAMSDWLDCSIVESVNDILKKEGNPCRYYAMWNDYQGITLLFLTPEEAGNFERATGCTLHTEL